MSALPRPLQNSIENKRELFDIGLHGPDILFYYRPILKNDVSSQGYVMHDRPADDFFNRAAEVIAKSEDPAAARAYIYGFICHFALDSECHPYVEKMIQVSGISHSEIEMEFDRMLLTEDFLNPLRHDSAKHIHPTIENGRVIAPFFEEVSPETVKQALRSMKFFLRILRVSDQRKRRLLMGGMKLARCYDSMHGMVMSLEPNPDCKEYCDLLKRRFSGAVPLAAGLILQYQKKLFQGGELPDRFHQTFGAGDHWEELRL